MTTPQNKDATGAQRDALGRVIAGSVSLNPGGRPKRNVLRQKCRELTDEALASLRAALNEPGERVQAAKVLLAYGYGSPEPKPIDDDADDEAGEMGGKVTPAAALKALDAAPLTPEPRGPTDPEN